MSLKILSFDLETALVLPPTANLHDYMPLPISVASTVIDGGEECVWHSADATGKPASQMNRKTATELIEYLSQKQKEGYMVCGWNSLSFDFYCLSGASHMYTKCAEVAKKSFDPMYQFFNHFGFYIGLQSVAEGLDIKFKKSISGPEVPKKWLQGHHEEVLKYVVDDSKVLNEIVKAIIDSGWISWKSKKGDYPSRCLGRLRTCEEVILTEMADQSWMTGQVPKKWKSTKWFPSDSFPDGEEGARPPLGRGVNLFQVKGADKETAEDVVLEIESRDVEMAESMANKMGLYINKTVLINAGETSKVRPERGSSAKISNRSVLILIFGLLGMTGCLPLGIAAFVMGDKDIKAMNEGHLVQHGRLFTQVGKYTGLIGSIINAIVWLSIFRLF